MPKPKKSFKTIELKLTAKHYNLLPSLTKNRGGWQTPYQHMAQTVKSDGAGGYVARVREADLKKLTEFALKAEDGTYELTALDPNASD